MEKTEVILVDSRDNQTGTCEKMEAHERGLLHRAFSVFIFDSKGQLLLQQRSFHKYHSGGLWTNACCSHPAPGEDTAAGASRRLKEEIGIEAPLEKIFDFVYRSHFQNGLTEHEFDHVFVGEYEGEINYNADEVMDVCYKPLNLVRTELVNEPWKYTAWFHLAFPRIEDWWNLKYGRT
jgi:isopentenyl-diphosphate delta-isomerase